MVGYNAYPYYGGQPPPHPPAPNAAAYPQYVYNPQQLNYPMPYYEEQAQTQPQQSPTSSNKSSHHEQLDI